jgi:acetyl/propionyl-CoA carboxylase alpha subunit
VEREIHIAGQVHKYRLVRGREQGLIQVDGKQHTVHYVPLPDGRRMCLVDGRVVEWNGLPQGQAKWVRIGGALLCLEVIDPRRRRGSSAESQLGTGKAEIKAPMPGKVVTVLCEKGEAVTVNQGLVVLEAMKMENELRSPVSGVVVELNVKPGQAVEMSQRIAVIEPPAREE